MYFLQASSCSLEGMLVFNCCVFILGIYYRWKDLLRVLLDRGADLDAASEGNNNHTGIATKGHTDFLQVLTGQRLGLFPYCVIL